MNFNTIIFLANSQCRALAVAYEWCDKDGRDAKGNSVKTDIFKTMDQSIQAGDLVLGETQSRHNLCVYKVVQADVEVDLEHSGPIPWVVGRVDNKNLRDLRNNESAMIEVIRRKDKEKKRNELAETMLKDYGAELAKLGASLPGSPALQPPSSAD